MCKFALQLNEFARGRVKMYNLLIDGHKSNQKKDLNKLKSLQKQIENQIRNHGTIKKHK